MSDRIAVDQPGPDRAGRDAADLYEEPANAFVADFLGVSNLMDATVTGPSGRRAPGPAVGQLLGRGARGDVALPRAGQGRRSAPSGSASSRPAARGRTGCPACSPTSSTSAAASSWRFSWPAGTRSPPWCRTTARRRRRPGRPACRWRATCRPPAAHPRRRRRPPTTSPRTAQVGPAVCPASGRARRRAPRNLAGRGLAPLPRDRRVPRPAAAARWRPRHRPAGSGDRACPRIRARRTAFRPAARQPLTAVDVQKDSSLHGLAAQAGPLGLPRRLAADVPGRIPPADPGGQPVADRSRAGPGAAGLRLLPGVAPRLVLSVRGQPPAEPGRAVRLADQAADVRVPHGRAALRRRHRRRAARSAGWRSTVPGPVPGCSPRCWLTSGAESGRAVIGPTLAYHGRGGAAWTRGTARASASP